MVIEQKQKVFFDIRLKKVLEYSFQYDTCTEKVFSTCIETLVKDYNGNIIASDDFIEPYTSKEYIYNDGSKKVISHYTDNDIINTYISRILREFQNIIKCKEDTRELYKSLHGCGMDREDIDYNYDLWYQYKPLYDLFKKNNYSLDDIEIMEVSHV